MGIVEVKWTDIDGLHNHLADHVKLTYAGLLLQQDGGMSTLHPWHEVELVRGQTADMDALLQA
jgi:hypothetical protein